MTDPFDSLRGRALPAAPPETDALDSVVAAGRRRRNRALVGGGAGTALLAGVLVLALAGGNEAPQTLDVIDDPSPSESVVDESSPDPSPSTSAATSASASASASAGPQPSESGTHPTDPEPEPSASNPHDWTRSYNDGEPGWSGGFSGCHQAGDSADEPSMEPGLTVETALPRTGWRPGEDLLAYVVITNRGATRREEHFGKSGTIGTLWNSNGKPVSAMYFSDVIQMRPIHLDPGEETRVLVSAHTTICGDGPDDPKPKLAAGAYTVTFDLGYKWEPTPPVSVTLDPGASTRSAWPMQPRDVPRPVGRPCENIPLDDTQLTGLTMGLEPESYTVEGGERLDATLVVTATKATTLVTDPRANPIYVRGEAPLTSAGVDAGPFTEPTDYRERETARDDVPALRVGDSLRYPVSWVAESCPDGGTGPGTALPPGNYAVHFGLLVVLDSDARKYWLSDHTVNITVT